MAILFWLITHQQTVIALALAFLIGSIWGAWLEFSNTTKAHDTTPQA